jgi:hypothetical protein
MVRRLKIVLTFVFISFCTVFGIQFAHASSTEFTASELLESCNLAFPNNSELSNEEKIKGFYCVSYFKGLGTGLFVSQAIADIKTYEGWPICLPNGWTAEQLARVALKYAQDHPEELHKSWDDIAINAISESFHCPE